MKSHDSGKAGTTEKETEQPACHEEKYMTDPDCQRNNEMPETAENRTKRRKPPSDTITPRIGKA